MAPPLEQVIGSMLAHADDALRARTRVKLLVQIAQANGLPQDPIPDDAGGETLVDGAVTMDRVNDALDTLVESGVADVTVRVSSKAGPRPPNKRWDYTLAANPWSSGNWQLSEKHDTLCKAVVILYQDTPMYKLMQEAQALD